MGGLAHRMSDTAYLLARLKDDRVIGFGIFSEDKPTVIGRGRWVTLLTANGKTYDEARRRAVDLAVSYGCDIGPASAEALQRLSMGDHGLVEDQPARRIAELESEVATLRAILASVPAPDEDA